MAGWTKIGRSGEAAGRITLNAAAEKIIAQGGTMYAAKTEERASVVCYAGAEALLAVPAGIQSDFDCVIVDYDEALVSPSGLLLSFYLRGTPVLRLGVAEDPGQALANDLALAARERQDPDFMAYLANLKQYMDLMPAGTDLRYAALPDLPMDAELNSVPQPSP